LARRWYKIGFRNEKEGRGEDANQGRESASNSKSKTKTEAAAAGEEPTKDNQWASMFTGAYKDAVENPKEFLGTTPVKVTAAVGALITCAGLVGFYKFVKSCFFSKKDPMDPIPNTDASKKTDGDQSTRSSNKKKKR